MTPSPRALSTAMWVGLGALMAGRLLDLWWHSTHEGFETAGDQLRAHWLAWVGALILLAAAVIAARAGDQGVAMLAVLLGAAAYGGVAVWHFYEHSQLRDPDLPHVLLTISQVVLLAASPLAALSLRLQDAVASHG